MNNANVLKIGGFDTKKLNLIFNMLLAVGIVLSLPFLAAPSKLLLTDFLNLENAEVLILFIGVLFVVNLYRQVGNIAEYLLYWTRFIKNPRLTLVLTSMVLAILPVKGRTIISAPIIGQIAEKNKLNKFSAAMVDFLATHIVYLMFPIEGSVIVVLATFASIGFGLGTFVGYMLPGIIFMIGVITYYSSKTIGNAFLQLPHSSVTFAQAAKMTFPLLLLMFSLYLYEMHDITYAVITGTILFIGLTLAFLKPSEKQISAAIGSMDKQLILTLVLIFLFAATVSHLTFVNELAKSVVASSFTIPSLIIIGYLAGLVLGDSRGMASLIFPLLLPLIGSAPNAFQIIAITYASMYAGYLASPAHPCCHYAASYFDTPYLKVWNRIALAGIGAAAIIIAVALLR